MLRADMIRTSIVMCIFPKVANSIVLDTCKKGRHGASFKFRKNIITLRVFEFMFLMLLNNTWKSWSKEAGWSASCRAPPEYRNEWLLEEIFLFLFEKTDLHANKSSTYTNFCKAQFQIPHKISTSIPQYRI